MSAVNPVKEKVTSTDFSAHQDTFHWIVVVVISITVFIKPCFLLSLSVFTLHDPCHFLQYVHVFHCHLRMSAGFPIKEIVLSLK